MGNICPSSEETAQPVVVYGNYFDTESRIILAILSYCKIPHKFQDQGAAQDPSKQAYISHGGKQISGSQVRDYLRSEFKDNYQMKALYATGNDLISEERFYKLLQWQAFKNYCKQLRVLYTDKEKK